MVKGRKIFFFYSQILKLSIVELCYKLLLVVYLWSGHKIHHHTVRYYLFGNTNVNNFPQIVDSEINFYCRTEKKVIVSSLAILSKIVPLFWFSKLFQEKIVGLKNGFIVKKFLLFFIFTFNLVFVITNRKELMRCWKNIKSLRCIFDIIIYLNNG